MRKPYDYRYDSRENVLTAPSGTSILVDSTQPFWNVQEFVKELNDTLTKLHERKSKHNVKVKK